MFRHAHAVLVHEQPASALDLVRNLQALDPGSAILLYNGSADPLLLERIGWQGDNVHVVPGAQKLGWGNLLPFLVATGQFARELGGFDALTIVDSDQLLLRAGYTAMLERVFAAHPRAGMLVTSPRKTPAERIAFHMPTRDALLEADRWKPVFGSKASLDAHWGRWTFWPATVFSGAGLAAFTERWETDATLREVTAATQMGVTEEIIPASILSAMGYDLVPNPVNRIYVRFKTPITPGEVEDAFATDDAWWLHPVVRRWDDPIRTMVRTRWLDYEVPVDEARRLVAASPVRSLAPAGFLARQGVRTTAVGEELIATAAQRLMASAPGDLLEVGAATAWRAATLARIGATAWPRANVARVPQDGKVQPSMPPTTNHWQEARRPLEHMLEGLGLDGLGWEVATLAEALAGLQELAMVVLDGADGAAAWRDGQAAIEARLLPGGWVAATDGDTPGVAGDIALALLATGRFEPVAWMGTAVVMEQTASPF